MPRWLYLCIKYTVVAILYYGITYAYIISGIRRWEDSSPCFRREILLNSVFLCYLRFIDTRKPSVLLESIQLLVVYWILRQKNRHANNDDAQCLDYSNSRYLFWTHGLFNTVLWFYTVVTGLLVLVYVGVYIFSIVEQRFVIRPHDDLERGLTQAETQRLKQINFVRNPQIHENSDLAICTICLEEFGDGERLIQLPCDHNFHINCLNAWLRFHVVCPNCRANIRARLDNPNSSVEHGSSTPVSSLDIIEEVP